MCGTACRLAQCLTQVGSENLDSTTNQLPQLLKETAEIWENVARIMGVTTTGIKSQMIHLIQDIQKRHSGMDSNDHSYRQEFSKVKHYDYLFSIYSTIYVYICYV